MSEAVRCVDHECMEIGTYLRTSSKPVGPWCEYHYLRLDSSAPVQSHKLIKCCAHGKYPYGECPVCNRYIKR